LHQQLSHHIHHTIQTDSSFSSTIYSERQLSSTTPLRNPQFTTITYTIPSLTPTSTNVNYANASQSPSCSSTTSSAISSSGTSITMMDQKRAQRLERNRIAAKECRERKKAYVVNLENKASRLEDDNLILRQKILELKTKLERIEFKNQENVQLKHLVKDLKVKLMKIERDKLNQDDDGIGIDIGGVIIKDDVMLKWNR